MNRYILQKKFSDVITNSVDSDIGDDEAQMENEMYRLFGEINDYSWDKNASGVDQSWYTYGNQLIDTDLSSATEANYESALKSFRVWSTYAFYENDFVITSISAEQVNQL